MADTFIERFEYLQRLTPQIRQKIITKNTLERNSIAYNTTVSQINNLLSVYEEKLHQLRNELLAHTNEKRYPRLELDRRQQLIISVTTTLKQLQDEMENPGRNSRADLLRQSNNNNRISAWEDDIQPENGKSLTFQQARDQQQVLFVEQEKGLDTLGEIISKQKYIAMDIGSEIEVQNELLDGINDAMDQTDERLLRNSRNIKKVSVKSSTCGLWVVIILLFVANIIVATI